MSSKLRNQRQRDPKQVAEVVRRKRKIRCKSDAKLNEWGVANFCPERSPGEDQSSLALHVATIAAEFRKIGSQRSESKIKHAMDRLCPERRREIISGVLIAELHGKYPVLFEADQVYNFPFNFIY